MGDMDWDGRNPVYHSYDERKFTLEDTLVVIGSISFCLGALCLTAKVDEASSEDKKKLHSKITALEFRVNQAEGLYCADKEVAASVTAARNNSPCFNLGSGPN